MIPGLLGLELPQAWFPARPSLAPAQPSVRLEALRLVPRSGGPLPWVGPVSSEVPASGQCVLEPLLAPVRQPPTGWADRLQGRQGWRESALA
jgi:hypothetical protein